MANEYLNGLVAKLETRKFVQFNIQFGEVLLGTEVVATLGQSDHSPNTVMLWKGKAVSQKGNLKMLERKTISKATALHFDVEFDRLLLRTAAQMLLDEADARF